VVVAVVRVRVVQVAGDEVVDVIAVRNRLVAATSAVDVAAVVALAGMLGSAPVGVLGVDLEHMLVDVVLVRMMQMALVQVVEMIAVRDGRVAATGPVFVGVIWVRGVLVHGPSLQETRSSRQAAESKTRSHPPGGLLGSCGRWSSGG